MDLQVLCEGVEELCEGGEAAHERGEFGVFVVIVVSCVVSDGGDYVVSSVERQAQR